MATDDTATLAWVRELVRGAEPVSLNGLTNSQFLTLVQHADSDLVLVVAIVTATTPTDFLTHAFPAAARRLHRGNGVHMPVLCATLQLDQLTEREAPPDEEEEEEQHEGEGDDKPLSESSSSSESSESESDEDTDTASVSSSSSSSSSESEQSTPAPVVFRRMDFQLVPTILTYYIGQRLADSSITVSDCVCVSTAASSSEVRHWQHIPLAALADDFSVLFRTVGTVLGVVDTDFLLTPPHELPTPPTANDKSPTAFFRQQAATFAGVPDLAVAVQKAVPAPYSAMVVVTYAFTPILSAGVPLVPGAWAVCDLVDSVLATVHMLRAKGAGIVVVPYDDVDMPHLPPVCGVHADGTSYVYGEVADLLRRVYQDVTGDTSVDGFVAAVAGPPRSVPVKTVFPIPVRPADLVQLAVTQWASVPPPPPFPEMGLVRPQHPARSSLAAARTALALFDGDLKDDIVPAVAFLAQRRLLTNPARYARFWTVNADDDGGAEQLLTVLARDDADAWHAATVLGCVGFQPPQVAFGGVAGSGVATTLTAAAAHYGLQAERAPTYVPTQVPSAAASTCMQLDTTADVPFAVFNCGGRYPAVALNPRIDPSGVTHHLPSMPVSVDSRTLSLYMATTRNVCDACARDDLGVFVAVAGAAPTAADVLVLVQPPTIVHKGPATAAVTAAVPVDKDVEELWRAWRAKIDEYMQSPSPSPPFEVCFAAHANGLDAAGFRALNARRTHLTHLLPGVVVYGADWCGWTTRARDMLQAANMPFQYVVIKGKEDVAGLPGGLTTIPIVFVSGKLLGGATELAAWLNVPVK
jgi:glutaredoxin